MTGIVKEAIIDPSDMKSHTRTVIIKRDIQISALNGERARKTPRPVAIPFPPLNLKKRENI